MDDTGYLPLSYLNHLVYCPRRFWYMYVQGELEINAPMLEGSYQHQVRADRPGAETDEQGRIIHRRLWVWSDVLQIAGFADFVEVAGQSLLPVERKHGKKGAWENDAVQLCAQALCLEEMTGTTIAHGEIFYWRSRRRQAVPLDAHLRQETRAAIRRARDLMQANAIPAPITDRSKCQLCSIQPICLPDEVTQLAGRQPAR
ncbi:MAG: CRISPR-associated protein Cas4 [Anaerolineales bacterium]|nr:CRISPR-associated protein Cas4 [Anaerolineales bacterium]